jgi:multidrug resistance efflux pump
VRNKLLLAGLVLVIGGLAGGWYVYTRLHNGHVLVLPGIVEIQEVRLGSKVGGRVARVLVQEGDLVSPGQNLVLFEAPELENQREQLRAKLAAAQAELDKALAGPRPEEKEMAREAVRAAKARYDRVEFGWREEEKRQAASEMASADAELLRATKELQRITTLFQQNSASQQDYEVALAARDRARGQFEAARAKNQMLQKGSRKEDIAEAYAEWKKAEANYEELKNGTREEDKALARAKVAETKAKLEEVEINLKEAVVSVPKDLGKAIVEVVSVRPGDLVQPNQPILRVLRADDLWVKVFVPETKLGLIPLNKEVDVRIDSFPDKVLHGVVIQKASISEFTPRNVQSVDERRYQVFAVKVRVDDPQGVLNAGMAAEVTIPLN